MSNYILYTFRRCPYAIRARMALVATKINCEIREVILKNKPIEMLELSPKGTVPVFETNIIIDESLDIMLWALQQNNFAPWLNFSAEITKLIHCYIEENDTLFKFHLDRYKYSQRYATNLLEHRDQAEIFLQKWEKCLTQNRFLVGDYISLADIAIFPFIRQFSKVDIKWFENLPYHNLIKWLKTHQESNLFQKVMTKYLPWNKKNEPIFLFTKEKNV